jgi:hypothetical protein
MTDENTDDETNNQRRSWSRRSLLRAAGAAGAVSVSAGAAAGQEDTATATPTPSGVQQADGSKADPTADTATATETAGEDEEREVLANLGDVTILEYRIGDEEADDDKAHVWTRLETEQPAGLVLSDIFSGLATDNGGEGVRRVAQKRVTIGSGKTWVRMPATVFDGEYVAVGVATTGGAVTISNGLPSKDEQLVSLPVGVAIGGATAITGTGAAAYSKYYDKNKSPTRAWDEDGGLL